MILRNPFYRRAFIAFSIPMIAAALISVAAFGALDLVIQSNDQLVSQHAADLIHVEKLRSAFEWKVASSRGFFLNRDPIFLVRESEARTEFSVELAHLIVSLKTDEGKQLIAEIEATENKHNDAVLDTIKYRRADNIKKMIEVFETRVRPKREKLRLAIAALETHAERLFESAKSRAKQNEAAARRLMIGTSITGLLIMSYIAFFMVRRLSNAYEAETTSRLRAESAVTLREDFLAIASHELKTPLTPLKLQSEMMLRRLDQPVGSDEIKHIRSGAETIDRQIDRLIRLVEDLLDVSWLQQGQFKLQPEEIDVVELVKDVIERFCGAEQGVRCELKTEIASNSVVEADRYRIEQAVTNILSNAIKYGSGKPIALNVTSSSANVELRVRDYGIGIAPEMQEKIFNRFERAVEHSKIGGLGLGLYITRRIIEIHGGTITVTSEPGQGSTFTVQIPRKHRRDERRELV